MQIFRHATPLPECMEKALHEIQSGEASCRQAS